MKKIFYFLLISTFLNCKTSPLAKSISVLDTKNKKNNSEIVDFEKSNQNKESAPDETMTRRKCCCPCCVNQSCGNFTVVSNLTVSGSATVKGALTVSSGSNGIKVGTPKILSGSGAPTLSAAQGSLYLRTDGTTTNDRAYINTDGSTTWTAIITAA